MNKLKVQTESIAFLEMFSSLFPVSFRPYLDQYCFIAGGAIRSLAVGKQVNDVDVFVSHSGMFQVMIDYLEKNKIAFSYRGAKAWSRVVDITVKGIDFQLINIMSGTPEDVVSTFDFTINQAYCTKAKGVVFLHEGDVRDRRLVLCPDYSNLIGVKKLEDRFLRFVNECFIPEDGEYDKVKRAVEMFDTRAASKRKEESKVWFTSYELKEVTAALIVRSCTCGAKHTSFPNHHYDWCAMKSFCAA